MKIFKIPEATITRLSVYSRYLKDLEKKRVVTISSSEIAEGVGVSSAQVRKDLAYFGEFGTKGVGYNVKDLLSYIRKILGLNKTWNLILIGAGNLGSALVTYQEFKDRGFNIVGVFDNDLVKIGKQIADLKVLPVEDLPDIIEKYDVRIGIIAVPAKAAQSVADVLVKNGIKAILNFAPINIHLPKGIAIQNVDLSIKLEALTFSLTASRQQYKLNVEHDE
ncbi:redox-sensing transcriptional repressor Rex [Peptococcaceae bacterium]|nr:redox-sensing transcriptional repressor Rex [Peptococcaceae bacterium]MCL0063250.1 redox-sensing transcriptional repressor Rex [Peptococcaceae bacterium]MCL0071872.1 redox-sensing transcriptional repressor Rex [Peptococcaceae bacterium]